MGTTAHTYSLSLSTFEMRLPLVSPPPPCTTPRSHISVLIRPHTLLVWGGQQDQVPWDDRVYLLDTHTFRWTFIRASGSVPPPLTQAAACQIGQGRMLMWGGMAATTERWRDVYELNTGTLAAQFSLHLPFLSERRTQPTYLSIASQCRSVGIATPSGSVATFHHHAAATSLSRCAQVGHLCSTVTTARSSRGPCTSSRLVGRLRRFSMTRWGTGD